MVIKTEQLKKSFKGVDAVKGVYLEVQDGEVFGFLGPNGAGKSTTIKMLCTLLRPSGGRAEVAGYDIVSQRVRVRQQIGLVFQDPTLDDRLTARENLLFHALLYNVPRAVREKRMQEVLNLVELADRQKDLVSTFSGGMRRRLEIARGLIHYPRLLFLDEPTIGLDPQTRNHIWKFIHSLQKRHQITIFLTTHYMDEAENCNRIAVIDHGEIIAEGTPDELKRQVGGAVVSMKVPDQEQALGWLKDTFGINGRKGPDQVLVRVENGEEFIPQLITRAPFAISSVNMHRPTLDDVFLNLTGRQIRDEGGGESSFHFQGRMMGGRMRH